MKIILFCATQRGYTILKDLKKLRPDDELMVFSFKEVPGEPRFFTDIKNFCSKNKIIFIEAKNTSQSKFKNRVKKFNPDLMLVVSWRYMISKELYSLAKIGTFVFHDSLLPKYRGFSPSVWAMINGEKNTGVTLFAIAEKVDSGQIVDQKKVVIKDEDTIAELLQRVTENYRLILKRNINKLLSNNFKPSRQNEKQATFCCKRVLEDNYLNWNQPAQRIYDKIRALTHPYQGAYSYLAGKKIYFWRASLVKRPQTYVGLIPGRVIRFSDQGVEVLANDSIVLLETVQIEKETETAAQNVLNRLSYTLK